MSVERKSKKLHPACQAMRDLRQASGLSLGQAQNRSGISGIVLGSYERGDRTPPLTKAEEILNCYGYTLTAVPMHANAVRLPVDMAAELRAIADQIDRARASNVVEMVKAYD